MEEVIEVEESKGKNKGFTLIELLIVIVILGILAAVTVFAVRGITEKGQDSACASEQKTILTGIEAFYANEATGEYPATLLALVPEYMTTEPTATNWAYVMTPFEADGDPATAGNQPVPASYTLDGIGECTDIALVGA